MHQVILLKPLPLYRSKHVSIFHVFEAVFSVVFSDLLLRFTMEGPNKNIIQMMEIKVGCGH